MNCASRVSERIRFFREREGYTAEATAAKLCMTVKTYVSLEDGKALPGPNVLQDIAELFGITIDELIRGKSTSVTVTRSISNDKGLCLSECDGAVINIGDSYTRQEKELIEAFRRLDLIRQSKAAAFILSLTEE